MGTLQDFPAVTAIDVSGRQNLSGEKTEKLVELLIPQLVTTRSVSGRGARGAVGRSYT